MKENSFQIVMSSNQLSYNYSNLSENYIAKIFLKNELGITVNTFIFSSAKSLRSALYDTVMAVWTISPDWVSKGNLNFIANFICKEILLKNVTKFTLRTNPVNDLDKYLISIPRSCSWPKKI